MCCRSLDSAAQNMIYIYKYIHFYLFFYIYKYQSKSHLITVLVIDNVIEPTAIEEANQNFSIKLSDIRLLDSMNFLGGAFSLDFVLKAYKINQTKKFVPLWIV